MSRPIVVEPGTTAHRALRVVVWAALVVAVVCVPYVFDEARVLSVGSNSLTVQLENIGQAVAYMVAVLGMTLLIGYGGQISLGNSFFMGIGAYLTAILVADYGWGYLLTLVVVVPICFLVGMAVGIPALRIQGLYLALVTLALAAIFPSLVRLDQLADRTGGSNGLDVGADLAAPGGVIGGLGEVLSSVPVLGDWMFGDGDLSSATEREIFTYFVAVIIAGICFLVVRNLLDSRFGRGIVAVRDDLTGASANGVNVAWTKTLTFGTSAALAGTAGMLYTTVLQFVAPDVFGINLAVLLIVALVVGGVGTRTGAVLGGLIIIFVPAWTAQIRDVPAVPERFLRGPTGTALLGLLLIVLTFVLPGGITRGMGGLVRRVLRIERTGGTADAVVLGRGRAAEEVPAEPSSTVKEQVEGPAGVPGR